MPGKITDLAALTGAAAATTDLIEAVDVSDTSMAATGTNKKITLADVATFVIANGGGGTPVGTKMTGLTALDGASAAGTDILEVVDVSDTTMASSGTNKKMTLAELLAFITLSGGVGVPTTRTISTTAPLTGGGDLSANRTLDLNTFTQTVKGAVPPPVTSPSGRLLRDDGAWVALGTLPTGVPIIPAEGGTGRNTGGTAYGLIAAGTTAAGIQQTVTPAASGFLKTTSATVLPAWAAITGADIAADSVTNTQLQPMATMTIKGNSTGSTAGPQDLAVSAVRSMVASGAGPMFGFDFDTTTTAGPAATRLRLNNATPASATIVYVSYTSKDGVDLKTRLLAGTAGDRIFIQDRANSANYRVYELTGAPTDNSTYATCNVVHRLGGGTITNLMEIAAGYQGAPFTVGTSAPSSPLTNDLWVDTT